MFKTRPDQAAMRSHMAHTDQHGREWDCTIDNRKESKFAPVTPPIPKFSAPFPGLVPPQHLVRPIIGKPGRLVIDYDAWLEDVRRARKAYTEQLRDYAHQRYQGQMVAVALENPPPDLLAMIGQPPPPLDFIRAMRAGNKWALGIRRADGTPYPMPPWAEPLLSWLVPVKEATTVEEDAAEFPDVEDDTDPEVIESAEVLADRARYQDLEEQYDPQATGGTAVRVGRGRRTTQTRAEA